MAIGRQFYSGSARPGGIYSQGSFPLGGRGNPFMSSIHEASGTAGPPPAPPLPPPELEEDEDELLLETDELGVCEVSSEHPHRQATTVASKNHCFIMVSLCQAELEAGSSG